MSSTPNFASTPINAAVNIATANPNRDGTGTIGTVYTATTGGARIDDLYIKARVTTTAGMIRLWIHDGTTYRFWREIPVYAVTPSATAMSFETQLVGLGLILQSGWSLRASTEKAESFDITVTNAGSLA